MFKRNSISIIGVTIICLGLVACDEAREAKERAFMERYEAEILARGAETIADCITVQCTVLDIDGMRLEDYSVINGLSHVTVLMASRTSFDNLDDIKGMRQLEELHISSTSVSDLTGLENFPRLKVLHIEGAMTGMDMSPIAQLTGLRELAMGELDKDFDASFIQNMLQLEKLAYSRFGQTADISILRGHPSLQNIHIYGELPADQSALLTLPKLKIITLNEVTLDPAVHDELESRGVFFSPRAYIVC